MIRDSSPDTIAALLPVIREIAAAAQGSDDETTPGLLLARALWRIDPDASQRQLRGLLGAAVAREDYRGASVISSDLSGSCRRAGQLAEALVLASQRQEYIRRAGLGPWTQLGNEGERLQILAEQGHAAQVLTKVEQLRQQMAEMPDESDQDESIAPFAVREVILQVGRTAARGLERWADALTLNAEMVESMRRRGAPSLEISIARYNDYEALLRLRRIADARTLLLECRAVYEEEHYTAGLAKVLSALADAEDEVGHGQAAIELERDALRYKYLADDVISVAVSHHNLGNYLSAYAAEHRQALAHHLASALLEALAGTGGVDISVRAAADDLAQLTDDTSAPASTSDLCGITGQIPGVRLDRLLGQLTDDPSIPQQALDALLTGARAAMGQQEVDLAGYLAAWDPVIAGITAAASGDQEARAAVEQHLADRQDSANWGKLAATLRAILDGARDGDLLAGLDSIDTAITRRALAALTGEVQLPASLWAAIPMSGLIGWVMDAAYGDQEAARQVTQALAEMAKDSDLAPLVAALGRIIDGERAPSLADGLDPVESAVVTTIVFHLAPYHQSASHVHTPETP